MTRRRKRAPADLSRDPVQIVYDVSDAILEVTQEVVGDALPRGGVSRDVTEPVRQSLHQLIDASFDVFSALLPVRGGPRGTEADPGAPSIVHVRGRPGSLASARVILTNDGTEPLHGIAIQASDLVGAGENCRIPSAAIALAPSAVDFLDVDEEEDVHVLIRVPADAPVGEGYLGLVTAPGLPRSEVVIRLDIDP